MIKKRRRPVWKLLLAVLTISLILSSMSVSVFADEDTASAENTESVITSEPSSDQETSDQSENADSELSAENTEDTDSVSESISEETEDASETSSEASENQADLSDETESEETLVSESTGTTNMYRFYNPNSGEHFYTSATREGLYLRNQGWKYEGVGWVAPLTSSSPVYRLYNPNAGDHHYTRSLNERNYLINHGWKYEGIGWYSDDNETIALTRQYNPNATSGSHNYTANAGEASYLVKVGWKDEGIAWYAVAEGRDGNALEDIGAITTYNGIDFSSIYDYDYYVSHNADLASISGDDEAVLKHFYQYGIYENRQAKEGVSPSSTEYQKIKNSLDPNLRFANQYASNTNYLITVNRNTHMVYIYQGSKGSWTQLKAWACGDGKATTPTPEGVFMIYGHTYMFGDGSHEFYASYFYGSCYFHSIIYSSAATSPDPAYIIDGRVGAGISHGCVRLKTENAKWIYDNIPLNTTVVVSHW